MTLFDILGLIGVFIILLVYGLLQAEKISASDWRFSALNALGAALILVSLIFDFNLPAFVIEFAWLAISLFGLAKGLRSRK